MRRSRISALSSFALPVLLPMIVIGGACRAQAPGAGARAWAPAPITPDDPAVAVVGEVSIFASDVQSQARRSGATARAALEDLIRLELLALAARNAGLGDDPEVRDTWKNVLVERMLEREFETRMSQKDIPDAYLRRIYDEKIDLFVHPRLVKVGVVSIYTGPRMKPEPRARATEIARQLAARVASSPSGTAADLQAIALDGAWGGKANYAETWQGPDRPFSAVVGEPVARLRKPGDTTNLIADETGFFIARYIEERSAKNVPFEAAQEILRPQVHEHWRRERFLELTQQLGAKHKVEVHSAPFLRPSRPDPGG